MKPLRRAPSRSAPAGPGLAALVALLTLAWAPLVPRAGQALTAQEPYDIVILGGRVMDPETGRDEIANVGIRGERIAVITPEPIRGRETVDASGHIVAPGFIDILSGIRARRKAHEDKVADGVTTTFGMHGGPLDVAGYVRSQRDARPVVNYAKTVDHRAAREAAGATDRYAPATPEQIPVMKELARQCRPSSSPRRRSSWG